MNNQNNFQNNGMNNPQQPQMGMQQPVQPQMGVQQPQMGMQQPVQPQMGVQQPMQQPAQPSKLKMSLDEAKNATKTQKQNALNESAEKLGLAPKQVKFVNIAIVICIIAFAISLLFAHKAAFVDFDDMLITTSGILVVLAASFLFAPKSTRAIGMVSGFGIVVYVLMAMITFFVANSVTDNIISAITKNSGTSETYIAAVVLSQIAWILLGGLVGTYFMLFFKNTENGEVFQSKPTHLEKMTNFALFVPVVFALISLILQIVYASSDVNTGAAVFITNSIFYFVIFALIVVAFCGIINRDKLNWIFVSGTNLLVIFTFIFEYVYKNSGRKSFVTGVDTTVFVFELLAFLVYTASAAYIMLTVYKRLPHKNLLFNHNLHLTKCKVECNNQLLTKHKVKCNNLNDLLCSSKKSEFFIHFFL